MIVASLAVFGPASQTGHIRFRPRFIEEYKLFYVERRLGFNPFFAGLLYVLSVLLTRTYRLFLKLQPNSTKAR